MHTEEHTAEQQQPQKTVEVTRCPHCKKHHESVKVEKHAEQQPDRSTHSGECPETGKRFPVWHSGK